ncbi:tartrate dehydratase alpha subunit/fumarate hydratase class I-like protein [Clostridium acetobutylicum]|nr:tartrate dehydratase alpha subunit/fumarate hydratase class I-like protein [Clostridium acetobutylicum]
MREIDSKVITEVVKKLCIETNYYLPQDIKEKINKYYEEEEWDIAKDVLNNIKENIDISYDENVPICQDTGMACVFFGYRTRGSCNRRVN